MRHRTHLLSQVVAVLAARFRIACIPAKEQGSQAVLDRWLTCVHAEGRSKMDARPPSRYRNPDETMAGFMTFGMGEARRDRSSIDGFDPCRGSLSPMRIPEIASI
jgi:hypothetical protein